MKIKIDKKIIKGCACYGVNKIHTCFCNPFVVIKPNKININPKKQKQND